MPLWQSLVFMVMLGLKVLYKRLKLVTVICGRFHNVVCSQCNVNEASGYQYIVVEFYHNFSLVALSELSKFEES